MRGGNNGDGELYFWSAGGVLKGDLLHVLIGPDRSNCAMGLSRKSVHARMIHSAAHVKGIGFV